MEYKQMTLDQYFAEQMTPWKCQTCGRYFKERGCLIYGEPISNCSFWKQREENHAAIHSGSDRRNICGNGNDRCAVGQDNAGGPKG